VEGQGFWRQGVEAVSRKGFKTLYAPTEAEIRDVVAKWLDDAIGTEASG
jgi:hypothetical protein